MTQTTANNDSELIHGGTCACPLCTGYSHDEDQASAHEVQTGVAGSGQPGDGIVGMGDAVGALLASGQSWNASNPGTPATVTYTMALNNWAYDSAASNGAYNVGTMNSAQKQAVHDTFQMYENIANIHFVEQNLGNDTDIVLRQATLPSGIAGWAAPWAYDNGQLAKVDVLFDRSYTSSPAEGNHPYVTFIHEIGHALGLSHPGNYNGYQGSGGNTFYDNHDATVMSYYQGEYVNATNGFAITPMLYDIAAIQQLYGVNHNYHAGNDTYQFNGADQVAMTIWDGAGIDTLSAYGYNGNVVLDIREGLYNVSQIGQTHIWAAFGANIENATGGNGADKITGNDLNNLLIGGNGVDTLAGGAGNDTLDGGAGADTYQFENGQGIDHVTDSDGQGLVFVGNVRISGTAAQIGANSYQLTVNGQVFNLAIISGALEISLSNGGKIVLDNFTSSQFDIALGGQTDGTGGADGTGGTSTGGDTTTSGGNRNDRLYGDSRDNAIHGNDGNDRIYGRGGNDHLTGDAGNDRLYGEDGDDLLDGGAGRDNLRGGAGNDSLDGGAGRDNLRGDDGDDILRGGDDRDNLNSGNGNDTLYGGNGDDRMTGGDGNDVLYGDAGNDRINGSNGDDVVNGGNGDDRMTGGDGNDTVNGGAGNDRINGSNGDDVVNGGNGDDRMTGGDGNDTVNGGAGNDKIAERGGDDILHGNDGDDTISVRDGNNFIFGDAGEDTIRGGRSNDVIHGGDDNDLIRDTRGTNELYGDDGDDNIIGGRDADVLNGGTGDDTLNGGNGDDVLTGGAGTDVFSFKGRGHDVITDFEQGIDHIQMRGNISQVLNSKVTYDADGAHIAINAATIVDILGIDQLTMDDFI